ncbi:MAG TPA: D-tyrosyl-tRNA(Tyr) deacylase [Thermoanaerobacterales bacterium]|nr:D-tyrosyl-tRNA(Tyr) deacylase [Thermoanaerobacterales bacterium]
MRAVIQRVSRGRVSVQNETVGEIGTGLVVLLGIGNSDTEQDADYLVDKIVNLRIFEDDSGKLNKSLLDIKGELMVVSQFTLYGDCRKGRRPSFTQAALPDKAEELYGLFIKKALQHRIRVETGQFQKEMLVEIFNDGPVTILLDSERKF